MPLRLRVAPLLFVLLVSACGDDPPAGPDAASGSDAGAACPLDEVTRSLLEEIAYENLRDAAHVTIYSHDRERGFAMSLTGADIYYLGFLTLAFDCTEPTQYDPYCEVGTLPPKEVDDPFYEEHDKCSRLGCEAAGIGTDHVYFTMRPIVAPDAPHEFTYDTTEPAGAAVQDPNPSVTWRADATDPEHLVVTADLAESLVLTPTGGQPIDLDRTGTVTADKLGEEPNSLAMELSFPDLRAGGPVTITIDIDADANATGSVARGDTVLATIGGAFALDMPPTFVWADCPP